MMPPRLEEDIEVRTLGEPVLVSVVIPHFYGGRDENFTALLNDLRAQTWKAMEIIIVQGVSPQGRAINRAVRLAKGEILVTLDDDSRLGNERVIENLVSVLAADPSIGMAGASVVIPPNASRFQRTASQQFPRFNMPVVNEVTESDLPGHPCAAFPIQVFIEAGMEREDILRGLDPDLRARIRRLGRRVVLAPGTWIHHPMPDSLSGLVRTFWRNGYGSAYLAKVHPELCYDTDEKTSASGFVAKRSFFYRVARYPVRLLASLMRFQWLRLLGYVVYVFGYAGGWLHFTLGKPKAFKASNSDQKAVSLSTHSI